MIVFYMAGKAMLIQSFAALYNYAIKGEFSIEPWYALVKIDPQVFTKVCKFTRNKQNLLYF